MSEWMVPSPIVRDLGHWSAHARLWSLTTARQGEDHRAISYGARLEELEGVAAKKASRFASESAVTFFRLPEVMKEEAASLDPASLLRPEPEGESRRFIEHFAEYLEFLGLSPQLRARACIVAPSEVSHAIVCPFTEPDADDRDTIVCCNLSEIEARLALPREPPPAESGPNEGNLDDKGGQDDEASQEESDAIAISLDLGDCLIGTRRSILGYLPDDNGEPTFWFECVVRNKRSSTRLP
jgi:hypothetical protein